MHIFPYSRRPGTPADKMPGQCTSALKAARAHEAQAVARRMHADFLRSCVGETLPVLFETGEGAGSVGHSDTYVLVRVPDEGCAASCARCASPASTGNGRTCGGARGFGRKQLTYCTNLYIIN